jgi:hypothetical protein
MRLRTSISPQLICYDEGVITIIENRVFVKFQEHAEHTKDLQTINKAWTICNSLAYTLLEPDSKPVFDSTLNEWSFPVWVAKKHLNEYCDLMRKNGIYK